MQNQSVNQSNNHQTKRSSYANYGKQLQNSVSGQQPHQQQQIWPSSLPTGWRREECMRPNGLGTGKSDVYYIRYVLLANLIDFYFSPSLPYYLAVLKIKLYEINKKCKQF